MGSSIRYQRRKSGLTQRELAEILGTIGDRQVARHENSHAMPSSLVVIGYEVVFQASAEQLFPGAYETVRQGIEQRLAEMERRLRENASKGRSVVDLARKLQWIEAWRIENMRG